MPRHPEPLEARLNRFIEQNEDGCWIWTGTVKRGSPMLKVHGERRCVRPLIFEVHHGGRPQSGMVDHPRIRMRCGGGACVNPAHMSVVTDEDRLLTQLKQEAYLRGLTRAQVNPRFGYMTTPAYIDAEARRQLDARLAAQTPLTSEAQSILDQIQRRPGARDLSHE